MTFATYPHTSIAAQSVGLGAADAGAGMSPGTKVAIGAAIGVVGAILWWTTLERKGVVARSGGWTSLSERDHADRIYDSAHARYGKASALDQVRGFFGVPDNKTSNPAFAAWRRHRGV